MSHFEVFWFVPANCFTANQVKDAFFLEKRISVQIGIIIWDDLSITHAWAIDNTIFISYLWFSNFDFDRTWRRLFQKSVGPRTKDFGTLWESRDDGAKPIWKESCTSINLICRYRILIQHATSMIWRCLKKLFFPPPPLPFHAMTDPYARTLSSCDWFHWYW